MDDSPLAGNPLINYKTFLLDTRLANTFLNSINFSGGLFRPFDHFRLNMSMLRVEHGHTVIKVKFASVGNSKANHFYRQQIYCFN